MTRSSPASRSDCAFLARRAVCGQGQFDGLAVGLTQAAELGDQRFQVAPQQWLTTGQADLLHAQTNHQPGDTGDLLEAEQ